MDAEKAIAYEFSSQYLADELPPEWDEKFLTKELPERARLSSLRLRRHVGDTGTAHLAELLRHSRNDRDHVVIKTISDVTSIDWSEERNWGVLQRLLDLIADHLDSPARPAA